ncbi:nicastrin-like [Tropilaelaps mercedesae]|uniref:Nicastrin n=1 Tax=Tropilaelaps mercedesae TaxID=418985 RepID=A0A1V9XJ20_9ACAR|nr:nicastrin-like [Tropilaelaps mercedesae]
MLQRAIKTHNWWTMWSAVCAVAFMLLVTPPRASASRGIPVQKRWNIHHFCFRRLNQTHQVGCSSSYHGDVGIVHVIKDDGDVQYIISKGPAAKYVPVIQDVDLSVSVLDEFARSGRVAGVIITRNGTAPTSFSPDDTCPNRQWSLPTNVTHCSWNDVAENKMGGAFLRDYPFPMFYVKNGTITGEIAACFDRFNQPTRQATAFERQKCAVKLYSPMNAAVNTRTCQRRSQLATFITNPKGFCDPLGDHNVMTILPAKAGTDSTDSVLANQTIILAARMDTFSLFDGLAPGADTAVSGIVGVLAAAEAIARHQADENVDPLEKNILFALFNGEAFDYIGSSRFVYDLYKGKANYNLTVNSISSLIEFNQLIPQVADNPTWYSHVDSQQYEDSNKTKEKFDAILNELKEGKTIIPMINDTLPPSSAYSFLRTLTGLPSVVITNHKDRYVNPYYNSIFDDNLYRVDDLGRLADNLAVVIKATAKSILRSARPKNATSPLQVQVNQTLIKHLLECYLVNSSCALFRSVVNEQSKFVLRETPYQLYIGVANPPNTLHPSTTLTYLALASFTKERVENASSMKACYGLKRFYPEWSFDYIFGPDPTQENPGICIRHRAATPIAKSPHFEELNDNDNRRKYSTWTESVWSNAHLELFVQASGLSELIALLSGVAILAFSAVTAFLMHRQADLIFEQVSPVAC